MGYRPTLKRPRILTMCALLYAIAPLINLFILSSMIGKPFFGPEGFMGNVHPILLVPLVLNPIVAYGIYSTRLWGWLTFVSYSVFLVGSHLMVTFSGTYPWYSVIGILGLTGFSMVVMFQSGVRAPFFNPKVRVWEQAIRVQAPIEVRLYCGDLILDAQTLDVSSTGCFVRADMGEEDVGSPVMITLDRKRFPVHAIGEIVRVTNDPQYSGAGVRFLSIDHRSKDNLANLISEIRNNGRPTPVEEPTKKTARKAS